MLLKHAPPLSNNKHKVQASSLRTHREINNKCARQQDLASGICQSHPWLRHVERSMWPHTVASGDSIRNALKELVYLLPEERGSAVQIQIYTVSSCSINIETHRTNN